MKNIPEYSKMSTAILLSWFKSSLASILPNRHFNMSNHEFLDALILAFQRQVSSESFGKIFKRTNEGIGCCHCLALAPKKSGGSISKGLWNPKGTKKDFPQLVLSPVQNELCALKFRIHSNTKHVRNMKSQ